MPEQPTGSCCGATSTLRLDAPGKRIDMPGKGHPVAVIGAAPVRLAAAAHLAERGLPFVVLEAGPHAGTAVREWGHVQLFSPWRYNTDPAACRLLGATGWTEPDGDRLPTGADLV